MRHTKSIVKIRPEILTTLLSKPIVITGMMACGKTSSAISISSILQIPHIDLDTEIEKSLQMTISEIFKKHGQDFFRNQELLTFENIISKLEQTLCVISLGGGAFCNENIRRIIKQKCLSIFLNTHIDIIFSRVKNTETRPLFTDQQSVKNLLEERLPIYKTADISIIQNENTEKKFIGKKIILNIENHLLGKKNKI